MISTFSRPPEAPAPAVWPAPATWTAPAATKTPLPNCPAIAAWQKPVRRPSAAVVMVRNYLSSPPVAGDA
jgi:hypothetical protein